MAVTKVRRFALTSDDFTASGDGTFEGDVFTLADPTTEVEYGTRTWGWEPQEADFDGDSNVILPDDVEMQAMRASVPYNHTDSEFYLWLKRTAGWDSTDDDLFLYVRFDTRPDDKLMATVEKLFATPACRIVNEDGAPVVDDRAEVAAAFPQDTWRLVAIRTVGTTLRMTVYAEDGGAVKELYHNPVDRTDAGTYGIYQTGASRIWTCGAAGGTKDGTKFALPSTGGARLIKAWTVPVTFDGFRKMYSDYNFTHDADGLNLGHVTMEYNLYHVGAWSGWTDIGADGDMSGVSATGNDLLLVGVSITNASSYRNWPGTSELNVTYDAVVPDVGVLTMKACMNALKDLIDADGTITALTGWDASRGAIVCYESSRDHIPLNSTLGVYVERGPTEPEPAGQGRTGGGASDHTTPALIWYNIALVPTVNCASSNPSDVLNADGALEDLTQVVEDAIKIENLSGTVEWIDWLGTDPDVGAAARSDKMYAKANRINLRVLAGKEAI